MHIGLAFHLSCSDAANHDVDVDVSRTVMPIRVSADDGGMTGEVLFAEFQAESLCGFHGQAIVGCIAWVKADDILVAFDITMLGAPGEFFAGKLVPRKRIWRAGAVWRTMAARSIISLFA